MLVPSSIRGDKLKLSSISKIPSLLYSIWKSGWDWGVGPLHSRGAGSGMDEELLHLKNKSVCKGHRDFIFECKFELLCDRSLINFIARKNRCMVQNRSLRQIPENFKKKQGNGRPCRDRGLLIGILPYFINASDQSVE